MFFSDALANTLSAIRVGYIARHRAVKVPVTKATKCILAALSSAGAIESFSIAADSKKHEYAMIQLAYINGRPAISRITMVSKKSNRCYISAHGLRQFLLTRRGVLILSTSHGIMLGKEACIKNIGGEALIWLNY